MTAPGTDVILKILKQMSFSLMNGNKVRPFNHYSLKEFLVRLLFIVMQEEEEQVLSLLLG